MQNPRVWLGKCNDLVQVLLCIGSTHIKNFSVTGASSGFGKALIQEALAKNDHVAALVRNPDDVQDLSNAHDSDSERLMILQCDVTNVNQISAAFSSVTARFGRIDVVVNSAGYAMLGEVEGTPEDAARRLFDVNFWGAVAVSKEAVRVFREKGLGGRLLNISSGSGIVGMPGVAYYCARYSFLIDFYVLL
jgi:NAD(P)-dependent dehydrogenase (short-subunit alcohol dehydrogenase family)